MDQILPPVSPQQPISQQPVAQPQPQIAQPSTKNNSSDKYLFLFLGILLLLVILIPLLFYSQIYKSTTKTPLPTPTPSFGIKNIIPGITAEDQNIQNTLHDLQNNLTAINQLSATNNASSTASVIQNKFKQSILLLSEENQRVDTLSKTFSPLIDSSSNSAVLTKTFVDLNNQISDIKITLKADTSLLTLLIPSSSTLQKTQATILNDFGKVQIDFSNIRSDFTKLRTDFFAVPSIGPLPCTPPPACIESHPACQIAEPAGGWCLSATPEATTPIPPTNTPTNPTK